uniref:Uncharacterized protein n=1 Tax=Euplotes harpa TaxID=151035 RepID=A0A7S3J556_9SPIT
MAATKNPQTLLKIKTTVQAEINVYIVKGFKVTVDIQKFKFKLNEITENNIDPTLDPRDISSFIGFISGFLRNYINQFIRNFEIKLPISDKINLKDIELKPKEHFIYADVTPYISIK